MSDRTERVSDWISRLSLWLAYVSGAALFSLMFLVAFSSLSRYIVKATLVPGNFEIAQFYLMPLATLPAVTYAYQSGSMPRFDLFVKRSSRRSARVQRIVNFTMELAVFAAIAFYSSLHAYAGFMDGSTFRAGTSLYMLGYGLVLVPIGFWLLTTRVALSLYLEIRERSERRSEPCRSSPRE